MNIGDRVEVRLSTAFIKNRVAGLTENVWTVVKGPSRAIASDSKRDIIAGEVIWDLESSGPTKHLPAEVRDARWVAERNIIPLPVTVEK